MFTPRALGGLFKVIGKRQHYERALSANYIFSAMNGNPIPLEDEKPEEKEYDKVDVSAIKSATNMVLKSKQALKKKREQASNKRT